MALDTQVMSVNLSGSIDQKSDPKLVLPTSMASLKNVVFTKLGRLNKRNGSFTLGTSISNPSAGRPSVVAATSIQSLAIQHENQLLMENQGYLYTYSSGLTSFLERGTLTPCEITSKTVVANEHTQICPDSATVNGVTVIAWEDDSGKVRYSVYEENSGCYRISDATADPFAVHTSMLYPKVVRFLSNIFITYIADGNKLCAVQVTMVTGTLATEKVLATDVNTAATGTRTVGQHDWCSVAGSALGDVVAFAYHAATPEIKFGFMDNAGNVIGSPTATGEVMDSCVSIYYTSAFGGGTSNLFLAWQNIATGIKRARYTFVAGGTTTAVVAPGVVVSTTTTMYNLTQCLDADNARMHLVFDTDQNYLISGGVGTGNFQDSIINHAIYTASTGTLVSNVVYARGMNLASKAVLDTEKATIYFIGVYQSVLQSTYFLLDLNGKTAAFDSPVFVQAKWLSGTAGGRPMRNILPELQEYPFASHQYLSCGTVKTRFRTDDYGSRVFSQTGITRHQINLRPTNNPQTAYLNKTTHISGGFLASYDGNTLCEQNFFLFPEYVDSFNGRNGLLSTITQAGDVSNQASFNIALGSGPSIASSTGANNYFTFYSTVGGYYLWYTVDGVGTSPGTGGLTSVPVSINSTDTAYEVALKTAAALNVFSVSGAFTVAPSSAGATILYITNNALGTPTAQPRTTGFVAPPGILVSGASYQYSVIWEWTDSSGQVHKSPASVPITVAPLVANCAAFLVITAPAITNRQLGKIRYSVYRTKANGTVFYKLDTYSATAPLVLSGSTTRYKFVDTNTSDAVLAARQVLYTTGSILQDDQVTNCKFMTVWKNRIVVSGLEDPYLVQFSQSSLDGTPLPFSSLLSTRLDPKGGAITGVAAMDDKLIIFKNDLIYYVAGEYPNDLGLQSTLTQPQQIVADVGCINANSIVLYPNGLIFKSSKGIYCLNRSLQVEYLGAAVENFNANVISSAVLIKDKNQVRFTHSDISTALVYDYYANKWSTFTNHQAQSALLSSGIYTRVTNAGWMIQEDSTSFADVDPAGTHSFSIYAETGWLKLQGTVQNFQRVKLASILGEFKSNHTLTIGVSYDYDVEPTNIQNHSFNAGAVINTTPPFPIGDGVYQCQFDLVRQKCQAIKFYFTDVPPASGGESLTLTDLSIEIGIKRGANKVKAAKSVG